MVDVVFVGCGAALEQLYRLPLRQMEDLGWLRVRGLVDPSEKRRAISVGWFRQAKTFEDLARAFETLGRMDLAIIASPPAFHSTQAILALKHDCHVLCEKPMAHSVATASEMVNTAREKKRLLAVGMVRRFYPSVAMAHVWIREGVGGYPLGFVYREGSMFDWPVASRSQFRRDTGGGGVLIDKGIHALDMLFYLLGPGRLLRSADDASSSMSVESNAALELQFTEGKGLLQVSWDAPLNNGLRIAGPVEELWLPLSPIDVVWARTKAHPPSWKKLNARAAWPSDLNENRSKVCTPRSFADCVRLQLVSVLRSIRFGEPPVATGEDGLEVLRLAMAAYDQTSPLNRPWLPEAEQRATRLTHWRSGNTSGGLPHPPEKMARGDFTQPSNATS
jgi:predicted dehydrogenase